MEKRKKGFTLMELLAVLTVLAIISLITVPIVMNVISDSRESSYQNSVNMYGKAVENAIAVYKMENPGSALPEYISQYVVETSGSTVRCNDYIENVNDNIILSDCWVYDENGNKKSKNPLTYTRGKLDKGFAVGKTVYSKGVQFLIYKNTSADQDYVTVIKAVPLTEQEVNQFGQGIINKYKGNRAYVGTNGVGLISYYESDTCNWMNSSGCNNQYKNSDIQKVVDNWANYVFNGGELKEVDGYKARLITYDELTQDLKYANGNTNANWVNAKTAPADYQWIYGQYSYWTMSPYYDSDNQLWFIDHDHLNYATIGGAGNIGAVRPVVNILKNKVQ